jgi:hypothetical protein
MWLASYAVHSVLKVLLLAPHSWLEAFHHVEDHVCLATWPWVDLWPPGVQCCQHAEPGFCASVLQTPTLCWAATRPSSARSHHACAVRAMHAPITTIAGTADGTLGGSSTGEPRDCGWQDPNPLHSCSTQLGPSLACVHVCCCGQWPGCSQTPVPTSTWKVQWSGCSSVSLL